MTTDTHSAIDTELGRSVNGLPPAESPRQRTMSDADIATEIRETLSQLAQIDASAIQVTLAKHVVTLHGRVRCWSEWHIVERVAWSTASVAAVHNHLVINYS